MKLPSWLTKEQDDAMKWADICKPTPEYFKTIGDSHAVVLAALVRSLIEKVEDLEAQVAAVDDLPCPDCDKLIEKGEKMEKAIEFAVKHAEVPERPGSVRLPLACFEGLRAALASLPDAKEPTGDDPGQTCGVTEPCYCKLFGLPEHGQPKADAKEPCKECGGKGKLWNYHAQDCATLEPCPKCQPSAKEPCPHCLDYGVIKGHECGCQPSGDERKEPKP